LYKVRSDAGLIGGARHEAVQGVDLAHQVALADAADGRVAAHLADGIQVVGEEQGLRPQAGAGQGRLATGVAAADDDDVETLRMVHRETS